MGGGGGGGGVGGGGGGGEGGNYGQEMRRKLACFGQSFVYDVIFLYIVTSHVHYFFVHCYVSHTYFSCIVLRFHLHYSNLVGLKKKKLLTETGFLSSVVK